MSPQITQEYLTRKIADTFSILSDHAVNTEPFNDQAPVASWDLISNRTRAVVANVCRIILAEENCMLEIQKNARSHPYAWEVTTKQPTPDACDDSQVTITSMKIRNKKSLNVWGKDLVESESYDLQQNEERVYGLLRANDEPTVHRQRLHKLSVLACKQAPKLAA